MFFLGRLSKAYTTTFTVTGGHWKAETSFLKRVTGRTKNTHKTTKNCIKKTTALRQKVLF
jgi:hypothetical protein